MNIPPQMRATILLVSCALAACGGGADNTLTQWPASQGGENPPPAPAPIEAVITNADALHDLLPADAVAKLFDPVAFGTTIRDVTDPVLVAFTVRATLAQLTDGSRPNAVYNWYGNHY